MGKRSATFFCCLLGVLCLSSATGDPLDCNPGFIRFPFARNGIDFTNACKGYGDYNAGGVLKLFHAGVDFQAEDTTEYVGTPFDPAYIIDALNVPGSSEWRLILAPLKWPHFCRQLVGWFSLDSGSFMVPGFPA